MFIAHNINYIHIDRFMFFIPFLKDRLVLKRERERERVKLQ